MNLLSDIRLGFRTLLKNPGFTAVAVTTLALGIGVNATVFTVTSAALFKGFPFVEGNDRLRYIVYKNSGCCVSYPDYLDWKNQTKSFDGMAIVHGISQVLTDENGFRERHDVTEVSSNTFQLVGRRPLLGRDFAPQDEAPGADPVAMLNYGFWASRFGKDPSLVGKTLNIGGTPTMVIGVMPEGFSFPQKLEWWVPLVPTPKVMKRENRDTWMAIGRLGNGATMAGAQAELDIIGKQLSKAYPLTNQDLAPDVETFTQFFLGPNAGMLYAAMWCAVGFVLLIACANLANLMLARAVGRSREISVRIALGAGRWRIIRQLLVESLMLSALGGFFGWWVARISVFAYQLAMASKSSWLILDYSMDSQVLWYLIAISIGTGLLFGLAPALRLSRLDVNSTLKDGARGATGGGRGKHLSAVLVTGEMALAVVLLAGAGVMIRSFLKVHNADIGVKTADALVTSVTPPPGKYPTATERISFFDRLSGHLGSIPGVTSLALTGSLPTWNGAKYPFELGGAAPVAEERRPRISTMTISPHYFETLSGAVLEGRDFNDADRPDSVPVAIVNQRFAAKFWPGQDPLGKRVRIFEGNTPEAWRTVVGVAANILQDDATRQEFGPLLYLPFGQRANTGMWLIARTRVPPASLTAAFRKEILASEPGLDLFGPSLLDDRLNLHLDSLFYGSLFLIFAVLALLLASVGLYAVIAHSVSQRTQEIGIRMAVGALSQDILRLVFRQGMLPLGIGLALGLAGSFAVNQVLKSMLVSVSPADPLTLAITAFVLLAAATLGCLIPARRAMRVDPVIALRHE